MGRSGRTTISDEARPNYSAEDTENEIGVDGSLTVPTNTAQDLSQIGISAPTCVARESAQSGESPNRPSTNKSPACVPAGHGSEVRGGPEVADLDSTPTAVNP